MSILHDSGSRQALLRRLDDLQPDSPRQWGSMRVDQMLSHVNSALRMTLGELQPVPRRVGVPAPVFRWLMLNMRWPRGAPTAPELRAPGRYELESERAQLKRLIQQVAERPLDANWPAHPAAGRMSGRHWSRLAHKHLDHHFRQFGI